MGILNRFPFTIKLKTGTRSRLLLTSTSNLGVAGEPFYTADTKQLFIHDGTRAQPVKTLDMAVIFEDAIVSNNNEIVYNY